MLLLPLLLLISWWLMLEQTLLIHFQWQDNVFLQLYRVNRRRITFVISSSKWIPTTNQSIHSFESKHIIISKSVLAQGDFESPTSKNRTLHVSAYLCVHSHLLALSHRQTCMWRLSLAWAYFTDHLWSCTNTPDLDCLTTIYGMILAK